MKQTQALTREELLQQADKEGIKISESTFKKYVTYGLLKGTRHSTGGRNGTAPATYERGLESLKLIDQWKKQYGYKPRDMVVLLYWRSLPVNHKVLYTQLQKFHVVVKSIMEKAGEVAEAGEISYQDEIRENMLPFFTESRSGPLDQNRKKQLDEAVQRQGQRILQMMCFLEILLKQGRLTSSALEVFTNPASLGTEDIHLDDEDTVLSLPYFHHDTWQQRMEPKENRAANRRHHQHMSQHLADFIAVLDDYHSVLNQSPAGQHDFVQKARANFLELKVADHPTLLLPVLYGIIGSGFSQQVLSWLQHPDSKAYWYNLMQSDLSLISQASLFGKGGESHDFSIHS